MGRRPMTPQMADCVGLWRRTVLIESDGSRDTAANVQWLQGISAFVDLRGPGEGFAGRLGQRGDIFEWTRLIDLQPGGPPDAGRMSWAGETLVEVGVHAVYTEHWVREKAPAAPCWAVLLSGTDAATALLVRVGARFGWAQQRKDRAEISLGTVTGGDWITTDSALIDRVGAALNPRLAAGQLRVADVDGDGAPTVLGWDVKESEGDVTL
jgi:hypothetical protein